MPRGNFTPAGPQGRRGTFTPRKEPMSRLEAAAIAIPQGFTFGADDERQGLQAKRADEWGVAGQAHNVLMDAMPGGIGRLVDAGTGVITDIIQGDGAGEAFTGARDDARADYRQAYEDRPVTAFLSEMVAGSLIPLSRGKQVVGGGRALAREGMRRGAQDGLIGGALYGFNAGDEGLTDRLQGGATGAGVGAVAGGALGAAGTAVFRGKGEGGRTLEATARSADINRSGVRALDTILSRSGLSRDDIDRTLVKIFNRLHMAHRGTGRTPRFIDAAVEELSDSAPQAASNLQRVHRQLQTAPTSQGRSAHILTKSIDDQVGSQEAYLSQIIDDTLGTASISDELDVLEAERAEIGNVRDAVINDARLGRGPNNPGVKDIARRFEDYSDDTEVSRFFKAAARKMGYRNPDELLARQPAEDGATYAGRLLEFGLEVQSGIFGQSKSAKGVSNYALQAREEIKDAIDKATRYRRGEHGRFAYDDSAVGPFKRQQRAFRENFSHEEAITEARGRLAKARDPANVDEFGRWFDSLPAGEQRLVRTVMRNDIRAMLRGGNVDDPMPWLVNLKKEGVADLLSRTLGDEGRQLAKAIETLATEQKTLKAIDARPVSGGAPQVVRGREAQEARHLYTRNPLRHLEDINYMAALPVDMTLSGGVPWLTGARLAGHLTRPSARTREALADVLAMQNTGARTRTAPVTPPAAGSGGASPSRGPSAPEPTPSAPQTPSAPSAAPAPSSTRAPTVAVQPYRRLEVDRAQSQQGGDVQARAMQRVDDEIQRQLLEAQQLEAAAARSAQAGDQTLARQESQYKLQATRARLKELEARRSAIAAANLKNAGRIFMNSLRRRGRAIREGFADSRRVADFEIDMANERTDVDLSAQRARAEDDRSRALVAQRQGLAPKAQEARELANRARQNEVSADALRAEIQGELRTIGAFRRGQVERASDNASNALLLAAKVRSGIASQMDNPKTATVHPDFAEFTASEVRQFIREMQDFAADERALADAFARSLSEVDEEAMTPAGREILAILQGMMDDRQALINHFFEPLFERNSIDIGPMRVAEYPQIQERMTTLSSAQKSLLRIEEVLDLLYDAMGIADDVPARQELRRVIQDSRNRAEMEWARGEGLAEDVDRQFNRARKRLKD